MDFRTLEITDRTKENYFTFESPVDYVTTTPNAEKFFKEVFTSRSSRNTTSLLHICGQHLEWLNEIDIQYLEDPNPSSLNPSSTSAAWKRCDDTVAIVDQNNDSPGSKPCC
jgi:hypothetical protein